MPFGKNKGLKKSIKKVGSAVRRVGKNVINPISNLAYSMRGRTTQEGGTTTTERSRGGSYKRYMAGKTKDVLSTTTKNVEKWGSGKYKLTKTKEKLVSGKGKKSTGMSWLTPVTTKTKTKIISANRAARIIKRGAKKQLKQQTNYKTLRNAFQGNKNRG